MFNFMKKATGAVVAAAEEADREEKRRKREKKERKEKQKRDRGSVSAEELLRIDEVRRSLKLRARRKEKEKLPSGITADYSASFFAELDRDANYSNFPLVTDQQGEENNHTGTGERTTAIVWRECLLQSDSSEASLNSLNNPNGVTKQPPNLPPMPPRPPKRGILKCPKGNSSNSPQTNGQCEGREFSECVHNGQDPAVLMQNTLRNEVISYQIVNSRNGVSDDLNNSQNFTKKVIHSPVDGYSRYYYNNCGPPPPINVTPEYSDEYRENGNSTITTSPSPSAETLTDTTSNSSFATPPFSMSPTGDSDGFHQFSSYLDGMNLPLPEIAPVVLPPPRILTIQRQKTPRSGFGFSLRNAIIVDNKGLSEGMSGSNPPDDDVKMKAVLFAEPGAVGESQETGLVPGNRLLEVNGVSVDDKSSDEIIELIKGSHNQVTVKVQTVAEFSEMYGSWANVDADDISISGEFGRQPYSRQNSEKVCLFSHFYSLFES